MTPVAVVRSTPVAVVPVAAVAVVRSTPVAVLRSTPVAVVPVASVDRLRWMSLWWLDCVIDCRGCRSRLQCLSLAVLPVSVAPVAPVSVA